MSKGTPSFGKHNKVSHIVCRRCGKHAYHIRKKKCANCGFPNSTIRSYKWQEKKTLSKKRKY